MQRLGYFTTIALVTLVIFLHFPFYGYETKQLETIYQPKVGRCPNGLNDLQKMGAEAFNKALAECRDRTETITTELPLSAWKSNSALTHWLAYPINAFASIIFLFFLGAVWHWIFESSKANQD